MDGKHHFKVFLLSFSFERKKLAKFEEKKCNAVMQVVDFPLIEGFSYVHFGSVEGCFNLNKTSDTPFTRIVKGVIT